MVGNEVVLGARDVEDADAGARDSDLTITVVSALGLEAHLIMLQGIEGTDGGDVAADVRQLRLDGHLVGESCTVGIADDGELVPQNVVAGGQLADDGLDELPILSLGALA